VSARDLRGAASPERIAEFIAAIAEVGRDPAGGWTRLAFTRAERDAHAVFADHAADAGLDVEVDAIGNSIAWSADGDDDAFLVGSHLDTVPQGGRFDGVAGVAVALEVARLLREHGVAPARYGAVAFAAEEGARFGVPCVGSRVAAGALAAADLATIADREACSIASAAAGVGLDPAAAGPWAGPRKRLRAFFEVHIEQGLVLERRGRVLGLVDSIAGSTRLLLSFTGRADHSGATPMTLRRDALVAASELTLEIEAAARRHPTSVATVGRLEVSPGSITTVPGGAELGVDVRDIDSERQRELAEAILDEALRISRRRDVELTASLLSDQSPVMLHQTLRRQLADAVVGLGTAFAVLPSGAMHDAAYMARLTPAALVFVPSEDGLSHAPAERSDVEHIARAAEAVAAVIAADVAARTGQSEVHRA
jgi:allantoate deiminase